MPDFDPNNIPVLDDIIEDEVKEKAKSVNPEEDPDALQAAESQAENNPELLAEDAIQPEPELTEPEPAEPHDAIINEAISDEFDAESHETGIDATETAIAAGEEAFSEPAHSAVDDAEAAQMAHHDPENNAASSNVQSITAPTDDLEASASALQISLQPLVKDIVQQLMPDLEQQLRFLVEQALQDKLPAEIIKQENSETDD